MIRNLNTSYMIDFIKKWGYEIAFIVLIIIAVILFKTCKIPHTGDNNDIGGVSIYEGRIDSLRSVVDSLNLLIDLNYVEHSVNQSQTEIRYIIKEKIIKDENYLSLDTSGRVAYFRKWVIDSAGLYK